MYPGIFFFPDTATVHTHPANSAANPDIFEPVSMKTLRVDGEIFESGEKKLRIQKYPDTCGRSLSLFAKSVFDKIFCNVLLITLEYVYYG